MRAPGGAEPGTTAPARTAQGPVSRAGVGVAETLVALTLTLFMVALLAPLLARQHRGAAGVLVRMEETASRRVARDFTGRLAHGGPGPGVAAPGDPVRVRRFIGYGRPCNPGGWIFRGERGPRPGEDSVWVVFADGSRAVGSLDGVGGGDCAGSWTGGGSASAHLTLSSPLLPGGAGPGAGNLPVVVRVYEGGVLSVSDAFRYGRQGRIAQPLTAPNLDPGGSRVGRTGEGLELVLRHPGDTLALSGRWAEIRE